MSGTRRWSLRKRRFDARLLSTFEPAPGNRIDPIERGESYYERMIAAIDAAARTVDVEMYLWDDDEVGRKFAAALERAAARGLRVRVLIDAYGARGVADLLKPVALSGGDVRVFSPFRILFLSRYLHRTHKKLLLLDGRLAFSGGAGFSVHWSGGARSERPWHDRMFEIEGMVVDQLEELFDADFSRWETMGEAAPPRERTPFDSVPAGASTLRVLRGWPDAHDFRKVLLEAVRRAKERVWIGTPYFLPALSLRRALRSAARRGVDVVVIHPSENFAHPVLWYAARARYDAWLSRSVKLHEFNASFYHAKIAVVDRTLAIVGTSNLDALSWRRNSEVDLAVTDEATVERMAGLFRDDLARSRAVSREEAGERGVWYFVRQSVALLLSRWM